MHDVDLVFAAIRCIYAPGNHRRCLSAADRRSAVTNSKTAILQSRDEEKMNLRFRRRLKIMPGLWVNFNKGMPSISMCGGPFTLNVGSKGIRGTAALHGTGLSVSETRLV